MNFLEEATARGFVHQCTDVDGLEQSMSKAICSYIGFDCTADSLHVGSLMQLMILRLLQKYGHRPIVLLGGATTKIGDPSGKDESRKMLSDEEIISVLSSEIKKRKDAIVLYEQGNRPELAEKEQKEIEV